MKVLIRFPLGPQLRRRPGKNRQLALAFGALLSPVSLMAYVLGGWRLAYDLGLAGQFGITGVFSHWQVWIGLAVVLHVAAAHLNRYGRGGPLEVPRVLTVFPSRPAGSATLSKERKGA